MAPCTFLKGGQLFQLELQLPKVSMVKRVRSYCFRCICPADARGEVGGLPDSMSFSYGASIIAISHHLVRPNDCHSFSEETAARATPVHRQNLSRVIVLY
ncbi:unnamed protein product [Macrosiphum euphorbiae]|uniref:Uncharacterized protein n=1 Tax=Macrosiphum euphorbiae TaxID=13131 RepID=A0AAV0XJR3_9HEMI|nr:unnamed protein product [Macrosiphum euphorbiae]